MMAGVVVRPLSEWCVGLEALVPERPSPAPATDPSKPRQGEQTP